MKISGWIKSCRKYITNPDYRWLINSELGKYDKMPDEEYLKRKYGILMGNKLNLDSPLTFNEKLQWLKLYNRKPEYTVMVDKYLARQYVADKIGKEYLIPLLGVWDNPDDIDFGALPDRFVLKCNHNSGLGMCICKDKSKLDIQKVKSELRKGLKKDYYLAGREWPYKNVPRKIICEKFMTDNPDTDSFTDYKFFCFNGEVDCVMVCLDRNTDDTKYYFFDRAWNLCRYNIRGKAAPEGFTVPKPEKIDEMFDLAGKLSTGLAFSRIDLYNSDGNIYFGEITFFPDSGFDARILPETDIYFGNRICLKGINDNENSGISNQPQGK